MGWGIAIECKSCDYHETLYQGPGMYYDFLDHLLTVLEPDKKNEVLELSKKHSINILDSDMSIYTCKRCNTLSSHIDLKLDIKGAETYRASYVCDKCSKQLETISDPILSDCCCPKCGSKTIGESSIVAMVMWD